MDDRLDRDGILPLNDDAEFVGRSVCTFGPFLALVERARRSGLLWAAPLGLTAPRSRSGPYDSIEAAQTALRLLLEGRPLTDPERERANRELAALIATRGVKPAEAGAASDG